MIQEINKRDVMVLLDKDGYLIRCGDPSTMATREITSCRKAGGKVSTIPYSEYEQTDWKWIWDKPKTVKQ
jgi:hypothetical protein